MAIHATLLRTGKVLYFDTTGEPPTGEPGDANEGEAYLLDPATRTVKRVQPPLINGKVPDLWCGAQSVLPDGRVLVTGGTLGYNRFRGLKTVHTFDPVTETWTRHADMRRGRWYPSQVELPDGRTAVMSGYDENTTFNTDIEVFDPATNRMTFVGSQDVGGRAPDGLYQHLFTMRSGRSLVAGPHREDSWLFTVNGSVFDRTDVPDLSTQRSLATGVLLPGGPNGAGSNSAMIIGGGSLGAGLQRSTEVFNEDSGTWSPGASMNFARSHHNTVLLPDGSMVTVGGGSSPDLADSSTSTLDHRNVEVLDPAANQWRIGPAQVERRAYHSVAVLLPDATVMSAGDDAAGGSSGTDGGRDRDTVEIYEPAYLQRGPRPQITGALQSAAAYGQTIPVDTSGGASRAVLVAPGATTHGADMSQRVVPVTTRQRAGGIDVVAPANANIAPPGHYMLFVLNADGVPSVARFIHLSDSPSAAGPGGGGVPAPNTPGTPAGAGAGVEAPGSPAKPRGSASSPPLRAALRVGPVSARALRRKPLQIGVRCSRACDVSLSLSHRGKRIASGRGSLSKAGSARVRLRLNRAGRKLRLRPGAVLALRGSLKSAGGRRTVVKRIVVRR